MFSQTEPGKAVIYGLAAVITGALAYNQEGWGVLPRVILAGASIIFGVIFAAWLLDLFAWLLTSAVANYRRGYYAPINKMLETLDSLPPDALGIVQSSGWVQKDLAPKSDGTVYEVWRTTQGGITPEEVRRMWSYCIDWPKYPELPPQHGISSRTTRAELQKFTLLACALGLAEPAKGPNAARWIADQRRIVEVLRI